MSRPFKLTPPQASEDALHASVAAALSVLLLPPAVWTHFPAGGLLSPQAAARLYRLGLASGWPNLLVAHDGRLYGIELKARTGRLSQTKVVRTRSGAARLRIGQVERHA